MANETKERKTLSPKLDIVFQALFGEEGSERITANLLQAILDEEITEIDLNKDPILRRDIPNDKLGILDIIAKINNKENCDIELQILEQEDIIERILFYWLKLYTIVILISDKKIESLKELEEYHTEWKIMETKKAQKILTDKFEIHISEIEKVKENSKENEK